jgi:hypothetical protein
MRLRKWRLEGLGRRRFEGLWRRFGGVGKGLYDNEIIEWVDVYMYWLRTGLIRENWAERI